MPGSQSTRASTKTTNSISDPTIPAWAQALQSDFNSLRVKIYNIPSEIEKSIASVLEPIKSDNARLNVKVVNLEHRVCHQQNQIDLLRSRTKRSTDRIIRMEAYSMRENIKISGIEESSDETEDSLVDTLMDIFGDDMELDTSMISINRCHRLYKSKAYARTGPRDVIVRFSSHRNKSYVLSATGKLKDRENPIYMNDQFPKEIEQRRRILRPALKIAKQKHRGRASLVQDKLIIKGKAYTVDNLSEIPLDTTALGTVQTTALGTVQTTALGTVQTTALGTVQTTALGTVQTTALGTVQTTALGTVQTTALGTVQTTALGTVQTEEYILFHGRYSPYSNFFTRPNLLSDEDGLSYEYILFHGRYSPYSNFFTRPNLLSDEDGLSYCSSEQFYQRAKAIHMGQERIAMEIMMETDPALIKSLGDWLPGDKSSWLKDAPAVMETAVQLKFQQNTDLLALMQGSEGRKHAECNQHDKFWGIGLSLSDPEAGNPDSWDGKNTLGTILDQVYDQLKPIEGPIEEPIE